MGRLPNRGSGAKRLNHVDETFYFVTRPLQSLAKIDETLISIDNIFKLYKQGIKSIRLDVLLGLDNEIARFFFDTILYKTHQKKTLESVSKLSSYFDKLNLTSFTNAFKIYQIEEKIQEHIEKYEDEMYSKSIFNKLMLDLKIILGIVKAPKKSKYMMNELNINTILFSSSEEEFSDEQQDVFNDEEIEINNLKHTDEPPILEKRRRRKNNNNNFNFKKKRSYFINTFFNDIIIYFY